jgi:hypothetical protein
MSLKHVDFESAFRRLAERRIEEAMEAGKFDNLPGKGEPIELEPMPAEENARLTWWCLRILKNADFTPHEVRYRKAIEHLQASLDVAETEDRVCGLVGQINDVVQKLNTIGTNAINVGVAPRSVALEIERWRSRRANRAG